MIISEGMHETASKDIFSLMQALRQEIMAVGFECYEPRVLSVQNPRFDFPD